MKDADHKNLSLIYESVGQMWYIVYAYTYSDLSTGYVRAACNHIKESPASKWQTAAVLWFREQAAPRGIQPEVLYGDYDSLLEKDGVAIIAGEEHYVAFVPSSKAKNKDDAYTIAWKHITDYANEEGNMNKAKLPPFESLLDSEDSDTFSDLL